jgi:hypothetical protein
LVHILRALRALQGSTKTSIRVDGEGVMSMQFMMKVSLSNSGDKGRNGRLGGGGMEEDDAPGTFVEFRVSGYVLCLYEKWLRWGEFVALRDDDDE